MATYLPDVRGNSDNWPSTIYVRNDDAQPQNVEITLLNQDGTVASSNIQDELLPNALWEFTPNLDNWQGAAVVNGNETLSAVVVHEKETPSYATEAYAGVAAPTSQVDIPIVQKANAGWYSDIFIQNAGTRASDISLSFLAHTDISSNIDNDNCSGPQYSYNLSLEPGASQKIRTEDLSDCNIGTKFVGSVRITNSANQPLAFASTQRKQTGVGSQLNETSNSQLPAKVAYAPLLQNNNGEWVSGLTLYKLANDSSFNVDYYHTDGNSSQKCATSSQTNSPFIIYPAPTANPIECSTTPSAVFKVDNTDTNMLANVNQLEDSSGATTYAAITNPSYSVVIPKLRNDGCWDDGFVIQNVNEESVDQYLRHRAEW